MGFSLLSQNVINKRLAMLRQVRIPSRASDPARKFDRLRGKWRALAPKGRERVAATHRRNPAAPPGSRCTDAAIARRERESDSLPKEKKTHLPDEPLTFLIKQPLARRSTKF